jgi:two-component system LytT family sensor kinase
MVNAFGHAAGALLFGIFVFLLARDHNGARLRGSRRAITAAILASLWNTLSLVQLALLDETSIAARILIAAGSSALSLLPAVLLQLAGDRGSTTLVGCGYLLALAAVVMHASEVFHPAPAIHRHALTLITIGFGALTLVAAAGALRSGEKDRRRRSSRLVGTMALFLFAMSFAHLGSAEALHAWPTELAIHHAGIPLALFLLLQDYRSIFVDAFIRLLATIMLAACFAAAAVAVVHVTPAGDVPVGLLLAALTAAFVLFAFLSSRLEALLSRLLFRRPDVELTIQHIRSSHPGAADPAGYLKWFGQQLGAFLGASPLPALNDELTVRLRAAQVVSPLTPAGVPACRDELESAGVEVVVPLRFAGGIRYVALGRRQGGRRYLSEDLHALTRISAQVGEDIERFREAELERLVSQAELRALQSQIHPHFLFNALNTLYGLIPRQAAGARNTVLNLADIFRYFLRAETSLVPFEEELRIVRAYLEIESMRLGPRLRTEILVEPEALSVPIPLLSVQPLVENAVKHGVSTSAEGGVVTVSGSVRDGRLHVRVRDTGPGFGSSAAAGLGVGLANVRRRLELCYGPEARITVETGDGVCVALQVPAALVKEACG